MKFPKLMLTGGAFLLLAFTAAGIRAGDAPGEPPALKMRLVTDKIHDPVAMAMPNDGSGRIFICQKEGQVWVVENNKVLPHPFLDVSKKMIEVNPGYDERGLLGLAFSPGFRKNKKFFVYYSAPTNQPDMDCRNILASFMVSANDRNRANERSERVIMQFEKPESNHNGGDLQFGPDGYLYLGLGDGGGGGDKHGRLGNGQNLGSWLGKILRIDVNRSPYSVPAGNPFVHTRGAKPEIWAYGMRNPWRFSFDKKTGQLFCSDVGQNKYEETDIIRRGGNYGWRVMEGFHIYNMPSEGADTAHMIKPIDEYDHHLGISVIGGYVYRGRSIPALEGKYVFGDYNGKIFCLEKNIAGGWTRSELKFENIPAGFQIFSFGQDMEGELYVLGAISNGSGLQGVVYKIVP